MSPDNRITRFWLLTVAYLALILSGCSDHAVDNSEPENSLTDPEVSLTLTERKLVGATNQFSFDLFQRVLSSSGESDNVFISPLSASFALGMAYNGAAGRTREEMQAALGFDDLSDSEINVSYRNVMHLLVDLDPNVAMTIGNSIWAHDGLPLRQEFVELNRTYFDASVRTLNFSEASSADTINQWVADNTAGKITEIVAKPVPPDLVALLVNAVYFKAAWTSRFNPDSTTEADFHLPNGSTARRDYMLMNSAFEMYSDTDFEALNLPYGDSSFNMLIILPDKDVGISTVLGRFTPENWDTWTGSLTRHELELYLPKFRFRYELSLKNTLTALGIERAFSDLADFSDMVNGGGVKFDDVKHKTFIQVDEEGTEAAAVTAISIFPTSIELNRLVCNRPFLFVIYERVSKTILFMGYISDPVFQ
jgi:serine protease inhibitor